jgi:hypothetical protein
MIRYVLFDLDHAHYGIRRITDLEPLLREML